MSPQALGALRRSW